MRHNHQRGCGSPTFSPLWRQFWLCLLFPLVQCLVEVDILCYTAGIVAATGICANPAFAWHLTSYCGCAGVPAPAKSHLIVASSRVAAQNRRQNGQSLLITSSNQQPTVCRNIIPRYPTPLPGFINLDLNLQLTFVWQPVAGSVSARRSRGPARREGCRWRS